MKISLNMNNTPDMSQGQRGGFAIPSIVKFPQMDDDDDKNCESIRTTKNEELQSGPISFSKVAPYQNLFD